MAKLIIAWDPEKRRYTQCDGRCYNAIGHRDLCRCICQGFNHGVGLELALKITAEMAPTFESALKIEGREEIRFGGLVGGGVKK